ncbi:MAG: nitroreductase family protein [Candidatus Bathyarchaeota archaeon]|nr:nitroreductase family protein [Candidatus Bathyarchaeota archaeon]
MAHVIDAIKTRRSVRTYSSRPVPLSTLQQVLEAAGWAPSAHNAQPWRFIVLASEAEKQVLAEAMAKAWMTDLAKQGVTLEVQESLCKASVERFTRAPVLIIACITMEDMDRYADEPRQRVERDLAVQSLGAALQNLLLAAHACGLGACWYCAPAFCKETVRKVLKIPEEVEPQALITLGYPAEKPRTPRRKQLQSYSYRDCWGGKL